MVEPFSRLKDRRSECGTNAPSCSGSHLTLNSIIATFKLQLQAALPRLLRLLLFLSLSPLCARILAQYDESSLPLLPSSCVPIRSSHFLLPALRFLVRRFPSFLPSLVQSLFF